MIWLWLSAGAMVATALFHSGLGEKRLIGPILRSELELVHYPLARQVLRFGWHATSVLMLISAAVVMWPATPQSLVVLTGGAWLATGLFNAFYTRGRHLAWPLLTLSGTFALIGAWA